jgi:hypothetical protein
MDRGTGAVVITSAPLPCDGGEGGRRRCCRPLRSAAAASTITVPPSELTDPLDGDGPANTCVRTHCRVASHRTVSLSLAASPDSGVEAGDEPCGDVDVVIECRRHARPVCPTTSWQPWGRFVRCDLVMGGARRGGELAGVTRCSDRLIGWTCFRGEPSAAVVCCLAT